MGTERSPRPEWAITAFRDDDVEEVSAMLGRAFSENPVARATLAHCSPEGRLARVIRLHRGLVRSVHLGGEIEVVRHEGRVVGASLTYPPEGNRAGLAAFAWTALGALGVGPRGTYRYWIYDKHVSPLHPSAPHHYLFILGVDPPHQGRGVGAALLRALCDRADRSRSPAYLETDKESSVRLYERHGFVVREDLTIPELGGLRTWTMWRPPRD